MADDGDVESEARRIAEIIRKLNIPEESKLSLDQIRQSIHDEKHYAGEKGRNISYSKASEVAQKKILRGIASNIKPQARPLAKLEESEERLRIQREQEESRRREKAARWESLRQAREERERTGGPLAKLARTEERLKVQSAQEGEEGTKKGIWLRYKEYRDKSKRDKEYNTRAESLMTDEQKDMSRNKARDYRKQQAYNLATGTVKAGWGVTKGVGSGLYRAGAGIITGGAAIAGTAAAKASGGTLFIIMAIFISLFDNKIIPFNKIPIINYIAIESSYHGLRLEKFISADWLGFLGTSIFLGIVGGFYLFDVLYGRKSIFSVLAIFFVLGIVGQDIIIPLKSLFSSQIYLIIAGIIFIALIIFLIAARRIAERDAFITKEEVTIMLLAYVITFLYIFKGSPLNPIGWAYDAQGWNFQAIFHVGFIVFFGLVYIRPYENAKGEPSRWHLWLVGLLLLDLFATGYLENQENLRFMPFLVFAVSFYVNGAEHGNKLAWIVIAATLAFTVFAPSVLHAETGGARIERIDPPEQQAESITERFVNAVRQWKDQQLSIATGGLYKGRVEDNQYEKLGLYLDRVRASEPRYYTEEPVTLWGTIKAKTLSDAVIVKFSCNKWTADNKKVYASKVEPTNFSIFNLEERDVECTFDPTKGDDAQRDAQRFPAGMHTVTMSAEYNFATDAYLKSYYIDRDRYRAMIREELDPFQEFGITDKRPVAVYTNGPVEIGMDLTPLIPVERTSVPSPALSITLNNRGRVIGQEGEILGEWEGRIKRINELVVLLPNGVQMEDPNILEGAPAIDCGDKKFKRYNKADCIKSCGTYVLNPCKETCSGIDNADDKKLCEDECTASENKCKKDCDIFFQDDNNKEYNGYSLITEDLKYVNDLKDIDRFRTFTCRLHPTKDVLGTTPITTRFIRARTRYNYTLEKSVIVPVELAPGSVSVDITGIILDESKDKVPEVLALAVAQTESRFRHCCREAGKNSDGNCVFVDEDNCGDDRLLTAISVNKKTGAVSHSVGLMQINKDAHAGEVSSVCGGKTLNDLDCNIKMGIKILKDGYGVEPKAYECGDFKTAYSKWERALRAYNGWACEGANLNYVREVIENACGIANGIIKIEYAPEDLINKLSIEDFKKQIQCP